MANVYPDTSLVLSTVLANKDLAPHAPATLFLAQITLYNGTVWYLASVGLNTGAGYFPYLGHDYEARILNQDISAIQMQSQYGIDIIPTVTLDLADADANGWTNFDSIGIGGATMNLVMIQWFPATSQTSTDSITKFTGICDSPTFTESKMRISASSKLNLERCSEPLLHFQPRCLWDFPTTNAQRAAGKSNYYSQFYRCGYSPDISGGVGNYVSGSTPFTTCNKLKSDCQLRLGNGTAKPNPTGIDIWHDSSARLTGRFSGITWQPPLSWRSKEYVSGKGINGFNATNDAIFGQYISTLVGTQLITDAAVLAPVGEANSTRFEVICCQGGLGSVSIIKVIVNDIAIPQYSSDALFIWRQITTGDRSGAPTVDAGFTDPSGVALGDTHGSMVKIEVVVPRQLTDSQSVPNVKVLMGGPWLTVPTTANPADAPWTPLATTNPAWVILDKMMARYTYGDVDLQSFLNAATYYSTFITYTDLSGNTGASHERFKSQIYVSGAKPRSVADIVHGLLVGCNSLLVPNDATGLIGIFPKQTLAFQQPSAVPGSNYNTAIASVLPNGTVTNGYSAYDFNESNYEVDTLEVDTLPLSSLKTAVSLAFQDEDNQYQQDTNTVYDTEASVLFGQSTPEPLNADGVSNFDQATRVQNIHLAEQLRGNPSARPGGTQTFKFRTSQRAAHLRNGHIITFTNQKRTLARQQLRVSGIQAAMDGRKWTVSAAWHRDDWYLDTFGQNPAPFYASAEKRRLNRLPYPWKPAQTFSGLNDPLVNPNSFTFAMVQTNVTNTDGSATPAVTIKGNHPINATNSVGAPRTPPQGTTATTGGSLPPGEYWVGFTSFDSAGVESVMSKLTATVVPVGTSTNTVTVAGLFWPAGAVGYCMYAGTSELTLGPLTPFSAQSSTTPPTSVTFGNLLYPSPAFQQPVYGSPDPLFDHYAIQIKQAVHLGTWGAAVTGVTSTVISIGGVTAWTVNQWAGHSISLIARAVGLGQAFINLQVTSNDAVGNLTFTGLSGSLVGYVSVGDIIIMRTKPSTFSATTIGDSLFANNTPGSSPSGLTVNGETGNLVRILFGTGRGQVRQIVSNTATVLTIDHAWDTVPDSTSVFIVEVLSDLVPKIRTSPILNSLQPVLLGGVRNIGTFSLPNTAGMQILVIVHTEDADNNRCIESYSPIRDMQIIGAAGTVGGNDGYYPLTIVSGHASPDLLNGKYQKVTLTSNQPITIDNPIWTGGTIIASTLLWIEFVEDGTAGWQPQPTWGNLYKSVSTQAVSDNQYVVASRKVFPFRWDGSAWQIDGQIFSTTP